MRPASSPAAALYTSVLTTVGAHFQVSVEAILGPRRTAHEVACRQVCCAILAALGERPAAIGRHLGRDHSTVVHSLATVARKPELGRLQARILASLPPAALLRLPNLTLDQALATLLGSTPPADALAIRRFLAADLLGPGCPARSSALAGPRRLLPRRPSRPPGAPARRAPPFRRAERGPGPGGLYRPPRAPDGRLVPLITVEVCAKG